MKFKSKSNRREFIKNTTISALGLTIVPSNVVSGLGHTAPSDILNVAGVGVGGMGKGKLKNMAKDIDVVALADVDWKYALP
ncbi:MAG TPA: gfo/Idh/MocA family oxidoreductase, partial [Saprospiraceae bacterium]|nr:gfo/Idh/MocA family oxidoreductase [Saprospiraceae bacterium]